jgi:exopolysaccharide biosynthesis polyprenyl glycosylphosphotransferase
MIRLFLQQRQKRALVLLIGDILLITLIIVFILILPSTITGDVKWNMLKALLVNGLLLGITLLSLYNLGLYDIFRIQRTDLLLISLSIALAVVFILCSTLSYIFLTLRPGKGFVVIYVSLAALFLYFWRLFNSKYFQVLPQRILIVGNDEIIKKLRKILEGGMGNNYTIVGHWHRQTSNSTLSTLASFVQENQIDVIVYSSHSQVLDRIANPLCKLRFQQKNIYEARSFYQLLTGKFPIFFHDDFGVLLNSEREFFFPGLAAKIKRVFDIVVSLACLPVATPLILLSAILIKLDSPGPIFFIQERSGLNEVPFKLIKMRTMVHKAERLYGPQWSSENDPRITRVGKILRKSRLDELPQFINVLKGEMSVIGPRPIRKHFADLLAQEIPYFRLRFLAKPGLTGWAQVNHDYAGSNEGQAEKLQYDLFYLVHQSLPMDLFILLKTIRVMVWAKGT